MGVKFFSSTFAPMKQIEPILFIVLQIVGVMGISAQQPIDSTDYLPQQQLSGVTVKARQTVRRPMGPTNTAEILRGELFKAACCNLGESFVTNPSVDVNYSDAATGARQMRLLGLGGTYVQLLSEGLPAFRGAAQPYALSYVPGSWMKSLQVSRGNASVKNGYEAMTGQVNIEYLKPEDDQGATFNAYTNTMGKLELNVDANVHMSQKLSTEFLGHFENGWNHHDGNGDGFQDDPNVRQYNFQNRWLWKGNRYIYHGGLSLVDEYRSSGQVAHDGHSFHENEGKDVTVSIPYNIRINNRHYELYQKHAWILDPEHATNIALMGQASLHRQESLFGARSYGVNEKNAYLSLMYETQLAASHNLSVGLSWNYDRLSQDYLLEAEKSSVHDKEQETTPGAYAQWTFNLHEKLVLMAGLRVDHSSVYGTFLTPRIHLKWRPSSWVTFRLSAGKGYRTPHALAEMSYLMASGRQLKVDRLQQEAAWNYGGVAAFYIPLGRQTLKLNAEYYYTHFLRQVVVDYDSSPTLLHITNLQGRSFSHTFQLDANLPLQNGLELTAAYRYNLVKSTYGGRLLWKPLQSRYKALFSVSYKPGMGLWQADATFAMNGGGRMPEAYVTPNGEPSWNNNFKAYPTLNVQLTRNFRHLSVYIGGENLTGYKQKHPVIDAQNPWSATFEPTMIYGPITGAMGYIGMRLNFGRHL